MEQEDIRRTPIRVGASYRSGSSPEPEHFHVRNVAYDVVEIVDRWYEGPRRAGNPIRYYFKVRSRGDSLFLLAYEEPSAQWFLVKALGPEDPT
ncbi:MAG: hypothetical protein ACE5G2_10195 [Candidatus Krumholzibacteriia bacterium]